MLRRIGIHGPGLLHHHLENFIADTMIRILPHISPDTGEDNPEGNKQKNGCNFSLMKRNRGPGNYGSNGWEIMLPAADNYPQNYQKRRRNTDGAPEPEQEKDEDGEGKVGINSGEQKD